METKEKIYFVRVRPLSLVRKLMPWDKSRWATINAEFQHVSIDKAKLDEAFSRLSTIAGEKGEEIVQIKHGRGGMIFVDVLGTKLDFIPVRGRW